jgi:hypothetical protein
LFEQEHMPREAAAGHFDDHKTVEIESIDVTSLFQIVDTDQDERDDIMLPQEISGIHTA